MQADCLLARILGPALGEQVHRYKEGKGKIRDDWAFSCAVALEYDRRKEFRNWAVKYDSWDLPCKNLEIYARRSWSRIFLGPPTSHISCLHQSILGESCSSSILPGIMFSILFDLTTKPNK